MCQSHVLPDLLCCHTTFWPHVICHHQLGQHSLWHAHLPIIIYSALLKKVQTFPGSTSSLNILCLNCHYLFIYENAIHKFLSKPADKLSNKQTNQVRNITSSQTITASKYKVWWRKKKINDNNDIKFLNEICLTLCFMSTLAAKIILEWLRQYFIMMLEARHAHQWVSE